jgi:hypothetical protein
VQVLGMRRIGPWAEYRCDMNDAGAIFSGELVHAP